MFIHVSEKRFQYEIQIKINLFVYNEVFWQFLNCIIVHQACIGTFGYNCSGGPCNEGYYGFGCLSKCNCFSQQVCDKIKGCTTGET